MYLVAGGLFALSRLPRFESRSRLSFPLGLLLGIAALVWHAIVLAHATVVPGGITLSIANSVSMIGLQLAAIALVAAFDAPLRGLSGGLLVLAGLAASPTGESASAPITLVWQLQAHILISIFAYGLLSVGAIVAVYTLVQDNRLRSGKISAVNQLFAPLETNERLLYGIAAGGFAALLLGVMSGFAFVDNLFAQHLVHKTVLSIIALMLFSILLAGRHFAGWRGRRAVYLYLWGFVFLGLAYFGSRYVLEDILHRSWG